MTPAELKAPIDEAINNKDIPALLEVIEWGRCACLGVQEGQEACPCWAKSRYVRSKVSYFALKRGRFLELKQ